MYNQPDVATIRATARRAKIERVGITENSIRRLVKTGELQHIVVGNRAYISWAVLMRFIQGGNNREEM